MRPALLLLAVFAVAAVAACGASAGGRTPIVFGVTGGNVIGYRVTIQPNGSVRLKGHGWKFRRQIRPAQVGRLRRQIRRAHLATTTCAGSLPDFATKFIRLGSRNYAVRGGCEPRFAHVFAGLEAAVALRASPR